MTAILAAATLHAGAAEARAIRTDRQHDQKTSDDGSPETTCEIGALLSDTAQASAGLDVWVDPSTSIDLTTFERRFSRPFMGLDIAVTAMLRRGQKHVIWAGWASLELIHPLMGWGAIIW